MRKQVFDFLGAGEQSNLFQGTKEQVPPPLIPSSGRASTVKTRPSSAVRPPLFLAKKGFSRTTYFRPNMPFCLGHFFIFLLTFLP